MFEDFSEEQRKQADNRAALVMLSNGRNNFGKQSIEQLYEAQLANTEITVIHQKDSYTKYGDGDEYEGYNSWIDFWKKNCDCKKELK